MNFYNTFRIIVAIMNLIYSIIKMYIVLKHKIII